MKVEELTSKVAVELTKSECINEVLSKAYSLLKDMKSFPKYMENVLKVIEEPDLEDNSKKIISWDCEIEDLEFNWKQANSYDDSNRTIYFELIEGDFDLLQGAWRVLDQNRKCVLQLSMKHAIGLPVIGEVLGPVLNEKLKTNAFKMLNSIKAELEVLYNER